MLISQCQAHPRCRMCKGACTELKGRPVQYFCQLASNWWKTPREALLSSCLAARCAQLCVQAAARCAAAAVASAVEQELSGTQQALAKTVPRVSAVADSLLQPGSTLQVILCYVKQAHTNCDISQCAIALACNARSYLSGCCHVTKLSPPSNACRKLALGL